MKNEIRYHNSLNSLHFKEFTVMDYNVLMALCYKLRDKGADEVTLTFAEIKKLAEADKNNYTNADFEKILDRMVDKLLGIKATYILGNKKSRFVLFKTFTTDIVEGTLVASVNEDFLFILNELTSNFTQFELKEFAELDSRYAKSLYRILKQYRNSGWWKPTPEELRNVLDIPQSYTNKIIMRDIIKPTLKALSGKFKGLKCEPIKARKRGAPIERYSFSFIAEKKKNEQPEEKTKPTRPNNNFNRFEQNQYDFEELEKQLLDN